jgi:multidrug efflux pump subunit AcrA (membrane-fusion protein)
MLNLKRLLSFLVPIGIGAALLFSFILMRKPPPQKAPEELTRSVRIITIKKGEFTPRLSGYGVVSPERTWDAVAQVSGRIAFVDPNFKRGAILQKGTEIIRISPKDYKIAIQQAKANIKASEAKLAELKAQEENARRSLEIEKRSLAIKQEDLNRKQKLLQRGTVAQSTVDVEQRAFLTQQARVQELENTLKLIPSQRNAQTQQIEVNKAQLETAELNHARTSITLPFNARIANVSVEETQYVGIGTKLGSAYGIEAAEVNVQIPLNQFRSFATVVTKGQPRMPRVITVQTFRKIMERLGLSASISMHFDDQAITWDGKVSRISDTIDPKTRTIGAIVRVNKPYVDVKPGIRPPLVKGMFVEAELRATPLKDQIVIPRSALHTDNVYVADKDNRLKIIPVKTKLLQGDKAVLENGLNVGDRLIVSDLSPAIPKMLLAPIEDKDLAAEIYDSKGAKASKQ